MPQKIEGQKDRESAREPVDNVVALEDGIVMGVVVEERDNISGGPSVAVGHIGEQVAVEQAKKWKKLLEEVEKLVQGIQSLEIVIEEKEEG